MYTPLQSQPTPHSNSPLSPRQIDHRSTCTVIHAGDPQDLNSSALTHHNYTSEANAAHCSRTQSNANRTWQKFSDLEYLDLSKLENFEMVNEQYREQGVYFRNAIALHPSNPAFPPRSTTIVLGGPKNGTIEFLFSPPVHTVEGYVTSSASTTMTAFDHQNKVINQDETLGRNLADQQSPYLPNSCLAVQAPLQTAIHRIRLRCSGGQVTLSGLRFSRAHC